MKEKTNVITEIGFPLCGCIAMAMIASLLWQMWTENTNAFEAQKNGPTELTYQALQTREDLITKQVKVTDVHVGIKYSIIQLEHGTSAGFLLFPTNDFELDPNAIPVVIQDSSVETREEGNKYRTQTSFTGTLTDEMGLYFDNKDMLEACYPGLNLNDCLLLKCPPTVASGDVVWVAISGLVFFGLLSLGFATWLFFSLKGIFKNGLTLLPEKSTIEKRPVGKALSYRPDRNVEYRPFEPTLADAEDQVTHIRSFYPMIHITKLVGIAAFAPAFPMALLGKANCLPEFLLPLFFALFNVAVVAGLGYLLLLFLQVKNPGTDIRKPIRNGVLPGRFQRAFDRDDKKLLPLGLNHVGDFLNKDNLVEVSREYLSDDQKSLVRILRRDGLKLMVAYSILDNGQVFMTIDREVPGLDHDLVNIIQGVRNKFDKNWLIHKQAVEGFDDVAIRIEPDELHAFWRYCEAIEQQMVRKRAMRMIPVPQFRSVNQDSQRGLELVQILQKCEQN